MKPITLNLNFAGAVLPVVECEDGLQRVPLKPLVEAIGVEWSRQHKKVQTPYYYSASARRGCPLRCHRQSPGAAVVG